MHNITQLKIWHASLELAEKVYDVTEQFPKSEYYGLHDQMRRAAVSVGSNIAEGAGRNSNKEFEHFLGIANGSLNELLFQTELGKRRNFIAENYYRDIQGQIDHLLRMNYQLQQRLRTSTDRNNRNSPNQH